MRSAFRISLGVALVVAACVALAAIGPAGCSMPGAIPESLTIFLSADTRGYLEPCGCRRDQAGGLPGRASAIRGSKAPQKLVLDAGNLSPGVRPYELLKLRYLLDAMTRLGYDAVNLGRKEAEMDLETLRKSLSEVKLPYVSANVLEKAGSKPVVERYRVVQRGKLRIGITGVTGSLGAGSADNGPGVEVRPPLEALAEVVPELKRRCDFLIVLAFVDEETQRQIAEKFHEVDSVLGGDVPQSSSSAQEINRATVFSVTDKGKVLGEIELRRRDGRYRAERAEGIKIVGDRLPKDPEMVSLIGRYKDELRERRYELASAEGMERIPGQESTADEFVGDRQCRSCHTEPARVTAASPHAHAFQTLVEKRSEFDPECLSCHTVGYGLHSGFVDAKLTAHLENVQCENCHGRGKEHVAQMTAALKAPALLAAARAHSTLKPVTPASCIRCHDEENSENFRYAAFWPRIKH